MITVDQVLEYYRREFHFTEGEESPNRDRYYWLSGLLSSVQSQVLTNLCYVGGTRNISKHYQEMEDNRVAIEDGTPRNNYHLSEKS